MGARKIERKMLQNNCLTMIYNTEYWAIMRKHKRMLVVEMGSLRWRCGKTRKEKKIRGYLGTLPIIKDKIRRDD